MSTSKGDEGVAEEDISDAIKAACDRPELVFALVPTLGSDRELVIRELKELLRVVGYSAHHIRLTERLQTAHQDGGESERIFALMEAADEVRQLLGRPEAMALLGIDSIAIQRGNEFGKKAWIIDSLVHPSEINILRGVYGNRLFIIGCDAPWTSRHEALVKKFMLRSPLKEPEAAQHALAAMYRHAGTQPPTTESTRKGGEIPKDFRLAVAKAHHEADVFVRTDETRGTNLVLKRLVECIFSHPFHTPSLDELGMAVAFHARAKSASLSRQVGSAIMVEDQIVSVGCNEVPRAGGGTYDTDSQPDGREWAIGSDPSDQFKSQILADLLDRLQRGSFLRKKSGDLGELTIEALRCETITGAQLFDIIEYARPAHAEMVAITGAARLGIKISGGTLFTTTLPCHECTRNIIASGIGRVVYLEPYPKSRGEDLYADSISMIAHHGAQDQKISFEPFSGFSYRRFTDLFSWVKRKEDDVKENEKDYSGLARLWDSQSPEVRQTIINPILKNAEVFTQYFREWIVQKALPEIGETEIPSNQLDELAEKIHGAIGRNAIYASIDLRGMQKRRYLRLVKPAQKSDSDPVE